MHPGGKRLARPAMQADGAEKLVGPRTDGHERHRVQHPFPRFSAMRPESLFGAGLRSGFGLASALGAFFGALDFSKGLKGMARSSAITMDR
jgi:hypothetical protein